MQFLLLVLLSFATAESSDPPALDQNSNRIGVSVYEHQTDTVSAEQLRLFSEIGVQIIETNQPGIIPESAYQDFYYFLNAGAIYATPRLILENISQYTRSIVDRVEDLPQEISNRVVAVSALKYPYEQHNQFRANAEVFADSLRQQIDRPLYFQSIKNSSEQLPNGFQFSSNRIETGFSDPLSTQYIHFIPSGTNRESLITLEHILNQTNDGRESVVIIPATWLTEMLEKYPDLQFVFERYHTGENIEIPLPKEDLSSPGMNLGVLLLLLIWASFVLHFKYQPIYAQSLTRYFTHHSFFVIDVMEHRLRSLLPGIYLLLQHAFLTGLFLVVSVDLLVSHTGLNILEYYFPAFFLFENALLNLFTLGFFLAILLQSISIVWIYLPNKEMNHFSQILNLYSWPLHINLFVVTALVIFNQIGFADSWVMALNILFVTVWFLSFNIAAIDAAKFLQRFRFLYLITTVGLHVMLVFGVIWYLLYTPSIIEPIQFAITVP